MFIGAQSTMDNMQGSNIPTPKPKGWATAKLRAATRKRLDILRGAGGDDALSIDAQINILIDEHYQKQRV
jgi:hypothetical protein